VAEVTQEVRARSVPAGALVTLSGGLAEQAGDVARGLGAARLGIPLLLAPGVGVLTERGEIEQVSAGAGVVFQGGRPEALAATASSADDAMVGLSDEIATLTQGRATTALVFAQADGIGLDAIEPLAAVPRLTALGGGTPGSVPIFAVDPDGRTSEGRAGALVLRGLTPARVCVSPACRLLMPLRPVTEARGPMVFGVGGEPALDVLKSVGSRLEGEPLLLGVLAPPERPDDARRTELAVRGIQGVDPARRAILLSGEVREGSRFAFAVRDAISSRTDLELATRELSRELQGSAPLFGVFVSCASRGTSLYATPDVDVRVIRTIFPDLPLVGLQSAFEIGPHAGRTTLHFYSGVLGIFTAPS
jgi:small ligand-binding sensory domain FIST